MRLAGSSYGEIGKKLRVPKSTLSVWFVTIPKPKSMFYTNRTEWLSKIRVKAAEANKEKRRKVVAEIAREVGKDMEKWDLDNRETQKSIMAMLYWAEGTKGRGIVQFANTDPRLMCLFVTLLRKLFTLDESKFRVRLHLHDYHREEEVKKFWSELLSIPLNKFYKSYRKQRSKEKTFRTNFGGICFVKYNSVYLQERIMQYALSIAEKLIGKIDVPVV